MDKEIERQVKARHDHARGCKKQIDDCSVCQKNVAWFGQLPLLVLSEALAEKQASR